MLQFFDKYYKVWVFIPISLLIVAAVVLLNSLVTTGSFMEKDVELTGGKMITIEVEKADITEIQAALPYASIHLTGAKNLLIEIPFEKDENEVLDELENIVDIQGEPNINIVGPALGDIFWEQTQSAIIFAFIAMSVIVFILFRKLVPCSLVVLAAVTDIAVTMMVLDFLGVKLSMPILAALLMIIGYSVDTNIVLTSNLLKFTGDIRERTKAAMKTGLAMSITTLVALTSLYIITSSFVLEQIALVIIIGILIDIPATWLTNAGLLRWWLER